MKCYNGDSVHLQNIYSIGHKKRQQTRCHSRGRDVREELEFLLATVESTGSGERGPDRAPETEDERVDRALTNNAPLDLLTVIKLKPKHIAKASTRRRSQ